MKHLWMSLLSAGMLAACTQPQTMRTYTNTLFGYSIEYPSSLATREFPDTRTGAGFRPAEEPSDPVKEVMHINAYDRPGNSKQLSFDIYVKTAAMNEIQNYQSLATISPVTTSANVTCYKTTWNVQDMGKTTLHVSLPITYCPLREKVLSFLLDQPSAEAVYDAMIPSIRTEK